MIIYRLNLQAISLKSAGEIVYQHRLIGLDTGWIASRQNTLEYLSLPPGNFTLQIFASNKFGVKSNILSIPFNIKKPFIETAWAQVPMAAACHCWHMDVYGVPV